MSEQRNEEPPLNEEPIEAAENDRTAEVSIPEETIEEPSSEAERPNEPPREPKASSGSVFCPQCGAKMAAKDVFCGACSWSPSQAAPPETARYGRSVTNPSHFNRLTALLLCLFLGIFGAHRFYVGKTGTAVLFVFTLGGFLCVGAIYDLVMIATGEFTDSEGRRLYYWQ